MQIIMQKILFFIFTHTFFSKIIWQFQYLLLLLPCKCALLSAKNIK